MKLKNVSVYSQAEIFRWKDCAGRIHYLGKQPAATAIAHRFSSMPSASVKLDVSLVKLGKNLCDPKYYRIVLGQEALSEKFIRTI